jgi:hypothetical protein
MSDTGLRSAPELYKEGGVYVQKVVRSASKQFLAAFWVLIMKVLLMVLSMLPQFPDDVLFLAVLLI